MLAQVPIGSTFGSPFGQTLGVGSLVSEILSVVFVVVGVILLAVFLIAGFSMIAGAGKNNPQQMEKSKQAATSAVIGFIIIFVAYWIIQLIEKVTGIQILNPVI